MKKPTMGNTPNDIVKFYFPGLPDGPQKHAREYILRLLCLHRWRLGASLDEVPHRLGEGIFALEMRERIETLAVRALYDAYFAARAQEYPDWKRFEELTDSLPRYGRLRGPESHPWPAQLPVLPLFLFGKNAKPLPRADEC